MANDQDNGRTQGDHVRTDKGDAGQKGRQGSGEDMSQGQQGGRQSGQKPEDGMNKDWQQTSETERQGGHAGGNQRDSQKPADEGRMGGQHTPGGNQPQDKDR
ncbi:hypothetical protein E2H86_13560 [Pseudomonas putida]|uniref:hypothetical protein n=1 Tax=Pseudomonas TaxID=286 RepID=UPI00105A6180|nr:MULTISPECIES: hypothetical protein [Pseudomonas]MBF8746284.1 hypothetical protein [Pseudomonas monteilii]MCT8166737.1 hypothetical protein [Pseudomonas sp. HD6422]MCT8185642.1 hypothetical protein [Pseudomonas sp. HD6421]TDJ76148.1 hypothetical protein E2H86_13560 [Pseudomonas putida]